MDEYERFVDHGTDTCSSGRHERPTSIREVRIGDDSVLDACRDRRGSENSSGWDVNKSHLKNIWLDAMSKEVEGLERNNISTVVDAPQVGEKAVDSKWVFQWKTSEHGYVMKAKARLAFRGHKQEIDNIQTFSPTPPNTTNRVTAAIACAERKMIFHFDVEQAFVRSDLKEGVYIRLPPGLGQWSGTIVKLSKTLYGLRQAAREWFGKLGGL